MKHPRSLLSLLLFTSLGLAGPNAASGDNFNRDNAFRVAVNRDIPASMRADDDWLRAPLPDAPPQTDPRDGIRRADGEPRIDPDLRDMAQRALGKASSPEVGGDDVRVTTVRYLDDVMIDIASNGDIYLAVGISTGDPDWEEWVEVYRSQDGGDAWSYYGVLYTAGRDDERLYKIDVVEGNVNRVYVTYMFFDEGRGRFDMQIAYTDLGPSTATWTRRTIMNEPGVSFLGPDVSTDVDAFGGFFMYAVCAGLDGNGDDIWFSRSTDYGNTWSVPYRIASLTSSGNLMYSRPMVAYGQGALVHVAYTHTERLQSTFDDSVRYVQAGNYGAASTDWGSHWALLSATDGQDQVTRDIVASATSPTVAIFSSIWFNLVNPQVFASYASGTTWSYTNLHDLPYYQSVDATLDQAGNRIVALGVMSPSDAPREIAMISASLGDLSTWTATQNFANLAPSNSGSPAIAIDPTRGNRVAVAWNAPHEGEYWACFDAEWRADPGYPNVDAGFPVAIPSDNAGLSYHRTPPAIVNVDGDPYGEIVFGDTDGKVYVVSHLGTIPGGWPRDVGEIPWNAPVAVGDLNGDGENEIVVGNTSGVVYAWDGQARLLPGFPVDLGTSAHTYVSIGAVGPPYHRWIVAASGNKIARINYRGVVEMKSGTLNGWYAGTPAIGDIDGDGDTEVVVNTLLNTLWSGVHVFNGDWSGGTQEFRSFPEGPNDTVTLGDLDEDGDLEICHPTTKGILYVMHHDLTDVAGFPYDNGTGAAITAVAMDQILGTFPPELIFASSDSRVHVMYNNGVEQTNFPANTSGGSPLRGAPIVTAIVDFNPWVTLGSTDRQLWSFRNVGATQAPGWPKWVGDQIEVSAAAGDLDNDGRNEIVFLGNDELHAVDVGTASGFAGLESWPMYAANPQRTGCMDCAEDLATPVPVSGASVVSFRLTSQNPSTGPVSFAATLPGPGVLELEVYDVRGRRVSLASRREVPAGTHQLGFDGRDARGSNLARGHYFARLRVQGSGFQQTEVRRFTLVD